MTVPALSENMENMPSGRTLRRTLRVLVTTIGVVTIVVAVSFLTYLRNETLRNAENRAASTARLLDEHISRTFRAAHFLAGQVAELGRSMPMDKLAHDEAAWYRLSSLKQGMPEPGTLWIVDEQGYTRLGTLTFPTPRTDVRDRRYVSAHLEARRDVVIGPLVQTKNRDAQAFHISRRIDNSDGALQGIAVVGFDAATFTDFYRNLGLGRNSNMIVLGLDGQVVLRQPDAAQWAETMLTSGPLMDALKTGRTRGLVRGSSLLDPVERITAFRVLPEFGIAVAAGVAIDDQLADWWESVIMTVTAVIALAALLGWLTGMVYRSLVREENLIQGLERNIHLRTREADERALDARRANEGKTRFLAAASHDLRQPLQAAGMFVEALSARMGDSPHQAIVDKLRQSIDSTQTLLSTLLDVSTLEAGHIEPSPTPFVLAPMMEALINQLEPDAEKRGLELRLVPSSLSVVSDPVLLERMLRNLLINALRYTPRGKVLLGCRRRGAKVAICVVDTGIGIPDDKFTAVFEDFSRLGTKGQGSDRGLGLGLGVVRRMAELLGHQVEISSKVGRGSSFSVVLTRL